MKLCFPVAQDQGLESTLFGHFASAPMFLLVDTVTNEFASVANCDELAPEAGCDPFKALINKNVHGVVVGGLGDNFLQLLNMMGLLVFQARSASIKESIELFRQGALEVVEMQNSADAGRCGDDEGSNDCDHSHDHEDEEDHGLC
jgi:predicted Fe-Mo cluster-binding NifX family protein